MRDQHLEHVILEELTREVSRRTGEDIAAFTDHVKARIAHGANVYGDLAFEHPERDNLLEHRDEMADGVAYPLFELHLINNTPTEVPDGVHQLLFEAMVHAAISHLKARQARALLRER